MGLRNAILSYNLAEALKETRLLLDNGCSVKDFYEKHLFEIVYDIGKELEPEVYDISKEHLASGIIRSIIEICYEYILKENIKPNNKSVILCSPENELHELTPRIISDYFTLEGYTSYFLGVNIPNIHIIEAIKHLNVDYIAISVTTHLNLVKLKDLVDLIKNNTNTKIILGGMAVNNNLEFVSKLNADYVITDLEGIGEIK